MRTKLFALLAIVALAFTGPAIANDKIENGTYVGGALTAVSTDVAIVVQYVGGGQGGGEVAVAAGGDITLTVATVADATTECPISGAYGGVIDVSDASCDTLGEVCDAINFSDDWTCAIVNGLRSDSSNNTLATKAQTETSGQGGLGLLYDTVVQLSMTQTCAPYEAQYAEWYQSGSSVDGVDLKENPWEGTRCAALWYEETVTTSGAATISLYSVKTTNKRGKINAAGTGFTGGSEVVKTLYSAPGGATTVNKQLSWLPYAHLISSPGERLVFRTSATTDLTVPTIVFSASWFRP